MLKTIGKEILYGIDFTKMIKIFNNKDITRNRFRNLEVKYEDFIRLLSKLKFET